MTDIDGNYNISALPADTLVFSMVGTATMKVGVGNRTTIDVKLLTETTMMEEVVVVGYGTQRVKDLTSSISTVKSEELTRTPASQAMQALQGKVAGLQVVTSGSRVLHQRSESGVLVHTRVRIMKHRSMSLTGCSLTTSIS